MHYPDYSLIPPSNVNFHPSWKPDPERLSQAKELLLQTGTVIIPIVVACTGVKNTCDFGPQYQLLHSQQLEMLLAYKELAKHMTEEERKGLPFSRCWDNMPAIVVNQTVKDGCDRNYEGKRDAAYEEVVLETLDWEFGTEPEPEFEESPASYNDVQVFEVDQYYLVVVQFNYRHDGNKYSRLLSKMPSDEYLDKLRDIDRECYFEVAQWALKK